MSQDSCIIVLLARYSSWLGRIVARRLLNVITDSVIPGSVISDSNFPCYTWFRNTTFRYTQVRYNRFPIPAGSATTPWKSGESRSCRRETELTTDFRCIWKSDVAKSLLIFKHFESHFSDDETTLQCKECDDGLRARIWILIAYVRSSVRSSFRSLVAWALISPS